MTVELCPLHNEPLCYVGPGQSQSGPPTCQVCDAIAVLQRWYAKQRVPGGQS